MKDFRIVTGLLLISTLCTFLSLEASIAPYEASSLPDKTPVLEATGTIDTIKRNTQKLIIQDLSHTRHQNSLHPTEFAFNEDTEVLRGQEKLDLFWLAAGDHVRVMYDPNLPDKEGLPLALKILIYSSFNAA